jgi:hypothetical protein
MAVLTSKGRGFRPRSPRERSGFENKKLYKKKGFVEKEHDALNLLLSTL